jgi:large subunit ribosomal protein L23
MKITDIIKNPRLTEKAYLHLSENKYVFDVDTHASKADVKDAVEKLFKVEVVGVRTSIRRSKKKLRGARRNIVYRTPKMKKAIVELATGQTIKFFDEIFKGETSEKK